MSGFLKLLYVVSAIIIGYCCLMSMWSNVKRTINPRDRTDRMGAVSGLLSSLVCVGLLVMGFREAYSQVWIA